MKPVIYTLEPIGVDGAEEATGTLFYCCDACRETALIERRVESDGPISLGKSGEWVSGTACDECGIKLSNPREEDEQEQARRLRG